jgi:hypothetical protein
MITSEMSGNPLRPGDRVRLVEGGALPKHLEAHRDSIVGEVVTSNRSEIVVRLDGEVEGNYGKKYRQVRINRFSLERA